VATARNGEVELFYETFGDPTNPTLLLVNGLGSQCTSYAEEWCQRFVDRGVQVIRFDNRDVGLSSKLEGVDYALADMASDAAAVLDAAGVERAHVMGLSMGGMIVQRMAIDLPERLITMTSVMSRPGEKGYGDSTPEALAALLAPPPRTKEELIERDVANSAIWGSKPEWRDEAALRARSAAAYDRCFHPEGVARQLRAVNADGSRTEALRHVQVPTLVIHGSRDTLISPSGGRRTAEVIPGARYVEIEGMGHDYPKAVWDRWVDEWSRFVAEVAAQPG
jgi:pimeloyl-ACP methyl ester carboxylesterase